MFLSILKEATIINATIMMSISVNKNSLNWSVDVLDKKYLGKK